MSSSNENKPLYVGLTGGIGCGKTTVLREFRKLGIPCFVADEVAGRYYDEPDFVDQVCVLMGEDIRGGNGKVDKQKIASKVFVDKLLLEKLNQLIHPRVLRDFEQWALTQKSEYVIFECAILFEHGLEKMMDQVVCVYLEKEERIKRLEFRDNVLRATLEARMSNQWSAEEKMELADWVILNYEGNPRARQVAFVDKCLREYIASK